MMYKSLESLLLEISIQSHFIDLQYLQYLISTPNQLTASTQQQQKCLLPRPTLLPAQTEVSITYISLFLHQQCY
jgi:hypothetical protein